MQEKMPTLKKVMYGTTERYSFSKLENVCELPDLLEIQKDAYKEFLETGILEILKEQSPITDYSGKAKLYFTGIELGKEPKWSIKDCKIRKAAYSVPLKVNARLVVEGLVGYGNEYFDKEIVFTNRAKKVLERAWLLAKKSNKQKIEAVDLLIAITEEPDSLAMKVLDQLGVDAVEIRHGIQAKVRRMG